MRSHFLLLKFSDNFAFNLDPKLKHALQLYPNTDLNLTIPSDSSKPWIFSQEQQELLKEYHHANTLLVDCLNSASNLTRFVRQEIEDTLLLPIAEIQKRHPPSN